MRLVHFSHNTRFFQGVLGTWFRSLESHKIIIGSVELEKIGCWESEKSGTYRCIPGT